MSASATVRDTSEPDERFQSTQRRELLALRASYTEQIEQWRATLVVLTDDGSQLDIVDDGGFGEGLPATSSASDPRPGLECPFADR
jgi:hypothetical protein